jgi:pimeloyl-ACP methyl ester carboxylesterase
MDTRSVAHDLEALRLALGEETLNYMGFSYGTQLGMAYAEIYPDKIRAMVLDGILDHAQSETNMALAESRTLESELNRFFDWCSMTTECALHGKDGAQLFDELIERASVTPIPAPGCAGQCRENVTAYELLYSLGQDETMLRKTPAPGQKAGWPLLSERLKSATEDDATAFAERIWFGGMADIEANQLWAGYGSECQDWVFIPLLVAVGHRTILTYGSSTEARRSPT